MIMLERIRFGPPELIDVERETGIKKLFPMALSACPIDGLLVTPVVGKKLDGQVRLLLVSLNRRDFKVFITAERVDI